MAWIEGEDGAADGAGRLRDEPGVPGADDVPGVRVFFTSTLGETSSLRRFPEESRRGSLKAGVSFDPLTGGPLGILDMLEGVDAMLCAIFIYKDRAQRYSYHCAIAQTFQIIRKVILNAWCPWKHSTDESTLLH